MYNPSAFANDKPWKIECDLFLVIQVYVRTHHEPSTSCHPIFWEPHSHKPFAGMLSRHWSLSHLLSSFLAGKSSIGVHPKCWQGIWWHKCRLSSWADRRRSILEAGGYISMHCVNMCSITISLRYHRLHPEYILTRIEKLGQSYNLRILLILCDVVGPSTLYSLTHT